MTSGGVRTSPRSKTGSASFVCKSSLHRAGDFRRLTHSVCGTARPLTGRRRRQEPQDQSKTAMLPVSNNNRNGCIIRGMVFILCRACLSRKERRSTRGKCCGWMGDGMFLAVWVRWVLGFGFFDWKLGDGLRAHCAWSSGPVDDESSAMLVTFKSVGQAAAVCNANPTHPSRNPSGSSRILLLLEPYYLPCPLRECHCFCNTTTNGDYHQDCDIIFDASTRFVDVLLN